MVGMAKAGYVFIGWTNTLANMLTWGAKDARLEIIQWLLPFLFADEAIVLDMAMSQFSFGAMQNAKMKNELCLCMADMIYRDN